MEAFIAGNRAVVARLKQDYLGVMTASGAAAPAGMLAHAVFDDIASALSAGSVPACAKGCHYCCHAKINLNPCEVFALARHIRDLPDDTRAAILDRLVDADGRTRRLSSRGRWALRLPCPMASADGACLAYEARPLACRAHGSFDAALCRREFEGHEDVGIPTLREYSLYRGLLWTALSLAERDRIGRIGVLELNAALSLVLSRPDIEAAWLAGEEALGEAVDADATARREALALAAAPANDV